MTTVIVCDKCGKSSVDKTEIAFTADGLFINKTSVFHLCSICIPLLNKWLEEKPTPK